MFDVDTMLCCDLLCKVGVCFCFAVFVDEWCLNLMSGYFVNGFVNLVCVVVSALLLMICV